MSKCEPIILIGQSIVHQGVTNHWCRPTKNNRRRSPLHKQLMVQIALQRPPCPYGAYPQHPAPRGRTKLPLGKVMPSYVTWCSFAEVVMFLFVTLLNEAFGRWYPLTLHYTWCSFAEVVMFFCHPFEWSLCYLDTSEILEQT